MTMLQYFCGECLQKLDPPVVVPESATIPVEPTVTVSTADVWAVLDDIDVVTAHDAYSRLAQQVGFGYVR